VKILYLCADRGISLEKFNGATAHFRSLVRAFSKLGHELLVLTPSVADAASIGAPVVRIPTPPQIQTLLDEVDREVPRAERPAQRERKRVAHALAHICNNVATEQTLAAEIERFRPDFVFELHSPFGAAGALTCNRLNQRHLLNVHAPLAWEGATFRSQALQPGAEFLEDAALRHARRIVTNSRQMRDLLIKANVDAGKIGVVINGVGLNLFTPTGETRRPVPAGAIVIGFSGSLKAWHGVEFLCDAFRQIADDPRVHLLVVGDGPQRKAVEALRAEMPDRVTFAGAHPLEDMPAWMRGMDIAVAPYPPMDNFYFSPLKVLDAMACGIANVASDIGQVSELLRDGETGLLVPPGDAAALAGALRKLANDPQLRARLGEAGLREAREHHDWQARAADIVEFAMSERAS
jgi:glycosyltransferase involved in cell wall biosynthesis